MKKALSTAALLIMLSFTAQAGDMQGVEINLNEAWNVTTTSADGESPVMVAMKVDYRLEQNSPILVMRCGKPGGMSVYIDWAGGKIMDQNRWVTFQFDDEQSVRTAWTLSASGYATYFPLASTAIVEASGLELPADFGDKIAESENLRASVIVGRETPKSARFRLNGTKKALRELRDGCRRNWSG